MEPEKKDRRGTPPGKGTVVLPNGSRIGNPPYEPTDEERANVRAWIKITSQEAIAGYMGISVDTLTRHFKEELRDGRFNMIATLGAKAIRMAMEGDRTMLIFVLKTQGKWNQRIEVTGKNGGPIQHVDLSKVLGTYSDEQLELLEPILEQLLAAGGDGLDFRNLIGAPTGAGGEGEEGA